MNKKNNEKRYEEAVADMKYYTSKITVEDTHTITMVKEKNDVGRLFTMIENAVIDIYGDSVESQTLMIRSTPNNPKQVFVSLVIQLDICASAMKNAEMLDTLVRIIKTFTKIVSDEELGIFTLDSPHLNERKWLKFTYDPQ